MQTTVCTYSGILATLEIGSLTKRNSRSNFTTTIHYTTGRGNTICCCQYYVIGWAWASPTLVHSMSRFVCTVRTHIRCTLQPVRLAYLVTHITRRYCHQVSLLSCPILSISSSKYVQRWGCAWAMMTDEEGKDCRWEVGQKSRRIAPLMHCYLTHPRPTMFLHSPSYMLPILQLPTSSLGTRLAVSMSWWMQPESAQVTMRWEWD